MIEKVEYLRSRANVSYEEAVEILEKTNGDLARAMCELERMGKVKQYKNNNNNNNNNNRSNDVRSFFEVLKDIFKKGFENRLVIKENDNIIANVSINFTLLFCFLAPHLSLITFILILILGYKIRFSKRQNINIDTDFKNFVNKATTNIKETVKSFSDINETEAKVYAKKTDTDGYSEINIE